MPKMSSLLFIFFSIIYLIFTSVMYFNMSPTQLNTSQTNIDKLFLTWINEPAW